MRLIWLNTKPYTKRQLINSFMTGDMFDGSIEIDRPFFIMFIHNLSCCSRFIHWRVNGMGRCVGWRGDKTLFKMWGQEFARKSCCNLTSLSFSSSLQWWLDLCEQTYSLDLASGWCSVLIFSQKCVWRRTQEAPKEAPGGRPRRRSQNGERGRRRRRKVWIEIELCRTNWSDLLRELPVLPTATNHLASLGHRVPLFLSLSVVLHSPWPSTHNLYSKEKT